MSDASTHPRVPELPRDEQRLATTPEARRRSTELLPTFLANTENALVVGSVTPTDRLLGTVTTYGDTGTDCHLLGDLYRTEVQRVLRWCRTTRHKRHRPPDPSMNG